MTERKETIKARDGKGRNIRTLEDAQNDLEAAEMRSRSMTFPQIAAAMQISLSTAYTRVQRGLALVPSDSVIERKQLELDKLDRIEAKLLNVMETDHIKVDHGKVIYDDEFGVRIIDDGPAVQAAVSLLRVQERRAKLLGLDAPSRQVVQVIPQEAVDAEIAQLEAEIAERADRSESRESSKVDGTSEDEG